MTNITIKSFTGLAALGLAVCSAVVSIQGFSESFGLGGVLLYLLISLEVGKVAAVALMDLPEIHWFKKFILGIFVFLLMGISCIGAYGYLTQQFEGNQAAYHEALLQVSLAEEAKLEAEKHYTYLNTQLQQRIEAMEKGWYKSKAMKEAQPGIDAGLVSLEEARLKVESLREHLLRVEKESSPFTKMAERLGIEIIWFTAVLPLVLVAIFDPLAVVLTACFFRLCQGRDIPLISDPPAPRKISQVLKQDKKKHSQQKAPTSIASFLPKIDFPTLIHHHLKFLPMTRKNI